MDKLENFEAPSSALILNHFQTAIISGSSLAPSEPEDLARMDAAVGGSISGRFIARWRH
jgi:hypothetical protein